MAAKIFWLFLVYGAPNDQPGLLMAFGGEFPSTRACAEAGQTALTSAGRDTAKQYACVEVPPRR